MLKTTWLESMRYTYTVEASVKVFYCNCSEIHPLVARREKSKQKPHVTLLCLCWVWFWFCFLYLFPVLTLLPYFSFIFPMCSVNIPHWYAPHVLPYSFLLFHLSVYAVPESDFHANIFLQSFTFLFQSIFSSVWIVFKLLALKCPFLLNCQRIESMLYRLTCECLHE